MKHQIIEKITNEFTKIRARNPSYSLRAFAKRLHIQPSALSEILNGKRNMTIKMAQKILIGLNISPLEATKIITGHIQEHAPEKNYNLSLQYFKAISDWYYFAILSLAEIPDFKGNAEWIAARLNITRREAHMALHRLIKLKMLKVNKNGDYQITGIQYKTPTDILNISLKNHTLQTLELASQSIIDVPLEKRDFSTVTMAIDPEKINEAKKIIKNFRKNFCKKIETGKKKEVYKLAIQFFPLTRNINN